MKLKKIASQAALGLSLLHGPWDALPVPGPTPAPLQIPKSNFESIWLESQGTLGSYVQKLKTPIKISKAEDADDVVAHISWMVKVFPNAKSSLPLDKANDDYAIRVGFVFARKGDALKMPEKTGENITEKFGTAVSRVVNYMAVPEETWNGISSQGKTCGKSAYESRFMNCLKPATDKDTKFKVLPFLDLKAEFGLSPTEMLEHQLVGVWLVYDSDNTKSKTSARLNQLEISSPSGAPKKTR